MCSLYEQFAPYVSRGLCKLRLIFPRINGPNVAATMCPPVLAGPLWRSSHQHLCFIAASKEDKEKEVDPKLLFPWREWLRGFLPGHTFTWDIDENDPDPTELTELKSGTRVSIWLRGVGDWGRHVSLPSYQCLYCSYKFLEDPFWESNVKEQNNTTL